MNLRSVRVSHRVDVTGIKGHLVKVNHIKMFHNSKIIFHRV